MENKDFEMIDNSSLDMEVKQEDFVLTQVDKTVHEQRFHNKPTTFFKDSLKRFRKNKSSVVATSILGILLLLAIFVPIFNTSDVSTSHPSETYLEPKLFDSGFGFWDGTKRWNNVPVSIEYSDEDPDGTNRELSWWPNPSRFVKSAVSDRTFTDLKFTNEKTDLGKEGYLQVGYYDIGKDEEYRGISSQNLTVPFDFTAETRLINFDTYDLDKLIELEGNLEGVKLPDNYEIGESALFFSYADEDLKIHKIQLTEWKKVHNIGSAVNRLKDEEEPVNITEKLVAAGLNESSVMNDIHLEINVKNDGRDSNTCALVRSLVIESDSLEPTFVNQFTGPSFTDANKCYCEESTTIINEKKVTNYSYWLKPRTNVKNIHMSKVYYCSFTYDSYEATYGRKVVKYGDKEYIGIVKLEEYRNNGWLDWDIDYTFDIDGNPIVDETIFKCEILDEDNCPLAEPIKVENIVYIGEEDPIPVILESVIYQYKVLGYKSMPRFLMGTDKSGKDMFKYVFEGLRTSLLLGIITSAVCFIFGLVWGSISGYFGGTTDLLMERFTDILHGVPWIVVMTLVIIHMGSNFVTFAIALCLTGWIGTAATTRTQFYRFKNREYVLASRTLGAKDSRLIFRHILPNAMGTIVTGAVLMVPSVIFSEATISYLGLGLKNLSSLGVILSNNQSELMDNPYLLIFPSVVIALLMICFNLFGNGLRDAINPSLKGEDE